MNKKFGLFSAAVITTAAMFAACGDEATSNALSGIPAISTESSSAMEGLDPLSSADALAPNSSDAAIVGSSAATAASSGASAIVGSSAATTTSSSATAGSSAATAASSGASAIVGSSAATATSSSATAGSSAATAASSGATAGSSAATAVSSAAASGEKQYAFGYALKNAARPSKGCGKNSTLQKTTSVENGDRFELNVNGENREFFITLPKNYNNNKSYKLLFAMHCMGSNAEDFVHHSPDADHPTPYYGQQNLDTEGNYIFVSPRGDTDGMPWSMSSDKDHKFFDKLLTTMEDNYCIDTTRVFVTGFSFGSMYSYSLAEEFQERIRAVVTYAVADFNIYEPHEKGTEKQLPIAWMNVHGKNDQRCPYNTALTSALPRVLKKNGKASDGDSKFTDASSEKPQEVNGFGHVCYDFKNVDERFPVKWCSWTGGHQWTASDDGNWQNSWVQEEVHKFFEQF